MADLDTAPRVKRQASPAAVTDRIRTEPRVDVAEYMSGFGNSFETEALAGALPVGRNSPQKVNYGLYAEQLSGSPFTAPQATNQRSWLYRIRPTVQAIPAASPRSIAGSFGPRRSADESDLPIGQLRWSPTPIPTRQLNFVTGLRTITTAGDAEAMSRHGGACAGRDRVDAARAFLQCRRRIADRRASRAAFASAPSSA